MIDQVPWQLMSPDVNARGWELTQVKYHYDVILGKMLEKEQKFEASLEVPYLKAINVQWSGVSFENLGTMWCSPHEAKILEIHEGDLLVCEGGEIGRATIIQTPPPKNCIIQNALHLVRPRTTGSIRYLRYLLIQATQSGWLDVLCNRATIAHFTSEKFKELPIWLPPLHEQRAIVDFLDRETAQIDALVSRKQRLLELLVERRQALITHAVTKGLDPDAPMKDSGVEWLGEIPEGWELSTLKYLSTSIQTGPFGSQLHAEDYIDNGVPVINPSHIRDGRIDPDWSISVDEQTQIRLAQHMLVEGDLVIARRGEMGRCGLVEAHQTGWLCGTGSLRIRLDMVSAFPMYLNLVMSLGGIKELLRLHSVGSTLDNLNSTIIGNVVVPVPPVSEQRAIVAFVTAQVGRIEELSQKVMKVVNMLQERRAALINEAVTGKIRVTE